MRGSLENAAASLAALLVLATACTDDETVEADEPPTEIAVDPLEFLGDLPCSNDPGAAKSYVAMLTDVDKGFTLGASPPAPCSARTAFRYVLVGDTYTAEIDVYDVPASELFPAGGATSGSRVMLDASGNVVAPRWRTTCGEGPGGGAVSAPDTSVVVAGCTPLESDGSAVTAIRVDPTTAFPAGGGELACRADGGVVDAIRVLPSGPASDTPLPPVTLACGDPIVFEDGLVEGASYAFRLEAQEAGTDVARWATECSAIVTEGVEHTASCGKFTSAGTISITGAAVEQQPAFLCGRDFDAFDLQLDGDTTITVPRTACEGETLVAPVPSGRYEGALRTYAAGVLVREGSCEVDVAPATTASVDCSFE